MANHLTTALANSSGRDDKAAARRETTAVFWTLLGISVALASVTGLAWPAIPWQAVFNTGDLVRGRELSAMVAVILALTLASIPLSLAYRVFDAYQEGWKVNAWQAAASALTLVALVAAVRFKASLATLATALLGPPIFASGLASLILFGRDRSYLIAGVTAVDRESIRSAFQGGVWFFLAAVQSIFWLSKDNLLIAHLVGPEYVGPYSTGFRVFFSLLGILGARVGQSLWPAYAEAIGKDHLGWIRSAYFRTLLATMGTYIAAAMIFATFASPLMRLWVGRDLVTSRPVVWALGAEFTVLCWANLMAYLLMAANRPRVVATSGLVAGGVSVVLGVILARVMGIAGIPVANTICLLVFQVPPLHSAVRLVLAGGTKERTGLVVAHAG
jgi:O-antigen/teichoic acid export membrane protein